MKNILFITDALRVGGGETYFYKIENLINREKFNFYTAAEDGECYYKIKKKDNFFILPSNKFKKIIELRKIIKENSISIVHCNSFNLAIITIILKKLTNMRIKILYTKHNATRLDGSDIFNNIINKYIDRMITVCDYDRRKLLKDGVKSERIVAIPNAIDIEEFRFKPRYFQKNNQINIGILARLSEEKNHKFFLKVIEELQKDNTINFKAFIAGDGVLREEICREITDKNLNICMLGNVDNPEEFLTNMDIKILVSTREVFPMTILEAMCIGSIVISSNVGGISDSVNENTGYLIDEFNEKQYVDVIKNIYNNFEKNKKLIENARKQIEEKFSLNTMLENIEKLYMEELK